MTGIFPKTKKPYERERKIENAIVRTFRHLIHGGWIEDDIPEIAEYNGDRSDSVIMKIRTKKKIIKPTRLKLMRIFLLALGNTPMRDIKLKDNQFKILPNSGIPKFQPIRSC